MKGYILYRKQREKNPKSEFHTLDYKEIVDSYVKVTDWRVKENSTVTYSVGGLILSNSVRSQPITGCRKFTMRRLEKHTRMRIFISTIFLLTGYCAGWSLKTADTGRSGGCDGQDHICSGEAFECSLQSDGEFSLGIMQNEWAGAQAFSSLIPTLHHL